METDIAIGLVSFIMGAIFTIMLIAVAKSK